MLSILSPTRLCLRSQRMLLMRGTASLTSDNKPTNAPSLPTTPPSPPIAKTVRFLTTPNSSPVYVGPFSKTIRLLKLFSVTTAALSVTFTPIMVVFGNPATPLAAKLTLSTIILTVGVSTTLLLHWFMKSYVTRLHIDRETDRVTVFTFDMIGRERGVEFHLSEATPPDRVATLCTFQARGQAYFVHADIFDDVRLLEQMAGPQIDWKDTTRQ